MNSNSALLDYTQKYFVPFREWWHTADPAWMQQRKEEWKLIKPRIVQYSNERFTAKQLRYLAHVYVTGEEYGEQAFEGAEITAPVSLRTPMRFVITPFDTVDQAAKLFDELPRSHMKREVFLGGLFSINLYCNDLAYVRAKSKAFIGGVIGSKYEVRRERNHPGSDSLEVFTPSPEYCVETWLSQSERFLLGRCMGGDRYSYVMDIIPYALSCISHIYREGEDFDEQEFHYLFDAMKLVEKSNSLSSVQQELLAKLHEAFQCSDTPKLVRSLYRSAFSAVG